MYFVIFQNKCNMSLDFYVKDKNLAVFKYMCTCTCKVFETIVYYQNKAKHYIIELTSKSDGKMTGNSKGGGE